MEILFKPYAWIALSTLVLMEIVLGIDNLLFLSIISGKPQPVLPDLVLVMLFRIELLLYIFLVLELSKILIEF